MATNISTRNSFYWSILIQWLTSHNILDEFLDITICNISSSYFTSRTYRVIWLQEHPSGNPEDATSEEIFAINLAKHIELLACRRVISQRFLRKYARNRVQSINTEFTNKLWTYVLEIFEHALIEYKVPNLALTRITKAIIKSGE